MNLEALLQPNPNGSFDIRIIPARHGIVGPRHLKGEAELPLHRNIPRGEAVAACRAFQDFLDQQNKRLNQKRKKR
jgi:hypothetical protein